MTHAQYLTLHTQLVALSHQVSSDHTGTIIVITVDTILILLYIMIGRLLHSMLG